MKDFKIINCNVTGEPILKIEGDRVTALQDCTIDVCGENYEGVKKGCEIKINEDKRIYWHRDHCMGISLAFDARELLDELDKRKAGE